MKIQKFILYLFPLFLVLQVTSCKDDDDGSGNNEPTPTFQNSCCKVPAQVACVGGAKVYIPNAFTPNGDGVNDLFRVYGNSNIQNINSFKITNSNNTIVFEKTDYTINSFDTGWDGTRLGSSPEDGLFNYEVIITSITGVTETLTGQVCCRFSSQPIPCVDLEKHCAYGLQHDGDGGFNSTNYTGENCQ